MRKKLKTTKNVLSILALSSVLLTTALPQRIVYAEAAANPIEQSVSSGTFDSEEVMRLLDGLTPEQKANINKLTGAENAQKNHVDPKDLLAAGKINVIVQFKVDPAKIQIIKQSLANGGATVNSEAFATEYAAAQQKVADSHAKFKSFVNTQLNTQIIGGKTVNSNMKITREYTEAFNGVALSLSANQVAAVAENSEVASVWSVIDFEASDAGSGGGSVPTLPADGYTGGKPTTGLSMLGIDQLHAEGHTGIFKSGPRAGQRVKVGVLDTGFDYNHPDLKNVYVQDGDHDFVSNTVDNDGNVHYFDDHDAMETIYPDYVAAKANPNPSEGAPPADYKEYITSHGTHVAGTIAARTTNTNPVLSANGVAPNVALYGYRVLGPGGHGSADSVLNGIDQATKDHMDVINLSLGASINDPLYPTSIAINNATLAGVTCAISAGNSGPGVATVGSPGTSPLAITVGAGTIPEEIAALTLTSGSKSYPARLLGRSFTQSDLDPEFAGKSFTIVDVGLGTKEEYTRDMKDKIALVKRGGETLTKKMANAKAAGAKGLIIWNNTADEEFQGYPSSILGIKADNLYSFVLTQAQGQELSNAAISNPNSTTITFPTKLDAPYMKKGDELAAFSSTGPVKTWDIKPDIVGPGVDIWSTAPYDLWDPQDTPTHNYEYSYQSISGTSMSSPHIAGIAALVLAAHPDYSPADVKTAIMNTAKSMDTATKTYSVYQVGAGSVNPAGAIHSNIKIQVLNKATTVDSSSGVPVVTQIDDITGSMFFGFKGRGEGSTNGSDDVVSSKDFNVINKGNSSKTFNVSTKFISTKFAKSNQVGPGTGNDVKVDFSVDGAPKTSITVGGGNTVKATAKITVPSNALDGTYEGYINLVNSTDPTETYRIPFAITVSVKGIDMNIVIKAFTLPYSITGNWNPDTSGAGGTIWNFSVNNAMESIYMLLKDKSGNYLGVIQNVAYIRAAGPGVIFGPNQMLAGGLYLPFKKPYNGTLDQSGIADRPSVIAEGAYSAEIIATDAAGQHYTAEDTFYVDYQAPTITMDNDSKPGIYEIDPTGFQLGQEIKTFYGTIYDSNVDIMKNNGEISIPSIEDLKTPKPVDQAMNTVWGYQDSIWPTTTFKTDANGRFHFGISPEDLTSKGSDFWIYPSDYAGAADMDSTKQRYHFIKAGSPYITYTTTGVANAGIGNQDKAIVDANIPFKETFAVKNAEGMTGGKITLNSNVYKFTNPRLTQEYKDYLTSKLGITDFATVLTKGEERVDSRFAGTSIDITISGISDIGALDAAHKDMNILEADVAYISESPISGPWEFYLRDTSLTLSGSVTPTAVPAFETNVPYVRQGSSLLTGGLFPEAFKNTDSLNASYTGITKASGAKVTVTNEAGKQFITDDPTRPNNTYNTVQYLGNNTGTYGVTMDVSDKPYDIELFVPGHFKGYLKSPVIGTNKFGYMSGGYKDIPNYATPSLLGGDVNGDNVIDIKDLLAEVKAFNVYGTKSTPADKAAFLSDPNNRNYDIRLGTTGSSAAIDYYDFYYIFKNFGKVNETAPNKAALTAQATLTSVDLTDPVVVKGVALKAGDGINEIMAALNFQGPAMKLTNASISDLTKGASVILTPLNPYLLDDEVWRNAITEIDFDGNNITNTVISGTTDKAVTIAAGYRLFDPVKGYSSVPSKITLHNSLFPTAKLYTVVIKAKGFQDLTISLPITTSPIATPFIPVELDPTKAHIGQDLTLTYQDDEDWRLGINSIVVKTPNYTSGIDITNLVDGTGNKYYDISQPGKITFNKDLFKAAAVGSAEAIVPGGSVYNPQLYKFEIGSKGKTSGITYPTAVVDKQPVGYGITFDTRGGTPIAPLAVGFRASSSQMTVNGITANLSATFPSVVKPGHSFIQWYADSAYTTAFQAGILTQDITIYASYNLTYIQNYAPVDKNNPSGAKFEGIGAGTVLGEAPVIITMPDKSLTPWMTSISSIKAEYYPEGAGTQQLSSYTMDPSTYVVDSEAGTITFTTATEAYATAHPNEKFAFSKAALSLGYSPFKGYKLTLTTNDGLVIIPDVRVMYRMHFDLNGGTLVNPSNTAFKDRLVTGKESAPPLKITPAPVKNGTYSLNTNDYFYDPVGTIASKVLTTDAAYAKDNRTLYLNWGKAAPTVNKDTTDNVVGSDITLTFTDDANWTSVITNVYMGSRLLEKGEGKDYTIAPGAIKIAKSVFTQAAKVNINIQATGYVDATVLNQVIGYQVTFNSNGGDAVAPQVVESRVVKPSDPNKVDYKFAGWYKDSELTERFDFADIITGPTTLYAKYALGTLLVLEDTTNNALGNNMTLEFSDSDWAHAITGIKVAGNTVSEATYKVDFAFGTIMLDKSLFTKAGDFNITISAKDYADVTVIQKVVNGYNVHFVLDGAPFEVQDQIVSRRITQPVVTGYDLSWFTDEEKTLPWDFTSSIYSSKTLYGSWSISKFNVMFDLQDGRFADSQSVEIHTTITAPTDPTRTGYTFGGWYMDAEGTQAWNFATDTVTADTILYAKWNLNVGNPGGGDTGSGNTGGEKDPIVITPPQGSAGYDGKVVKNPDGTTQLEVKMTPEQATKAIKDANASGASEVHLVIKDDNAVSSQNLDLSSDAIKALASSGKALSISTSKVELNIPSQSLNHASGEVNFKIEPVSEEGKQEIAGQASKQSIIKVVVGNNPVTVIGQPMKIDTNLQNTPVTLTLPLGDLSADQLKDLAIYIDHSDGTRELVKAEVVTIGENGQKGLRFTTNKFSTFSAVQIAGVDKYFSVKTKAYVHGYPDGTFKPAGKITRAEVATILAQISTKTASGTAMTFTDVSNDYWAMNAITTVTQMGLMDGYSDSTFRGDQEITRAELTSIIARLLGSSDTAAASKFSDITGHWAKVAIDQVAAAGIINGYEDGTFKPSNSLTRAEAVTMINHYLGRELTTPVTAPTWLDVPANHWAYKEIESASHDQD